MKAPSQEDEEEVFGYFSSVLTTFSQSNDGDSLGVALLRGGDRRLNASIASPKASRVVQTFKYKMHGNALACQDRINITVKRVARLSGEKLCFLIRTLCR